MTHHKCSYVIVPLVDLTDTMINQSSNGVNTMRHSLDNTKVMLMFASKHPDIMAGYRKYTLQEIAEVMEEDTWSEEISI